MFIIVFELITEEIVLACLLIRELYPAFFGSILFTRNAHLDKNEIGKTFKKSQHHQSDVKKDVREWER